MPEIRRIDLAEILLILKAQGIADMRAFPWLEALKSRRQPEPSNSYATSVLPTLSQGRLRSWGSGGVVPGHPRYARMLMAGHTYGSTREAALIAALTQTQDVLLRRPPRHIQEARERVLGDRSDSDFFILMLAWAMPNSMGTDSMPANGWAFMPAPRARWPSSSSFCTWLSTRGSPLTSAAPARRRCANAS